MAHLNTAEDVAKFISLLLIDILTFLGNSVMIFAGIRSQELRKFSNAFIFNMAFADLCQSVLVMPFGLASIYLGKWPLSSAACSGSGVVKVIITMTSVQSLAGISLDRYFYIVKNRRAIDSKKRVVISIAIVWLISILLSILPLFGWGELGFDHGKEVCTILFHKTASYTVVVFSIGLFIPVSIMAACYYKIFMVLRLQGLKLTASSKVSDCEMKNTHASTSSGKPAKLLRDIQQGYVDPSVCEARLKGGWCEEKTFVSEDESKVRDEEEEATEDKMKDMQSKNAERSFTAKELNLLRSVILVIFVFISCWLPYVVFNLLRAFSAVNENHVAAGITMWMGFANSALNPIIYGLTNRQFRNAIKKVLKNCCKSR